MIGPKIKEMREAMDVTQLEFANLIGVSPGTLSRIEKGKRTPSIGVVLRACHALRVTPDAILAGEMESLDDGPAA